MAFVTTAQRNELIALTIGMFNAAPGANYLNNLVTLFESGKTRMDIASVLATRAEFAEVYSPILGNDEFSARLVANLLGNEAGSAATQWAMNWAKAHLAAGESRAALIASAVQALQNSTSADFLPAKAMLLNKIDVASFYSVTKLYSSTSLTELQKVIAGVTSAPPTVVTAKAVIDDIIADYASFTFMLTPNTDAIISTAGNDTIYAVKSGALSVGDSIDGAAGADTLRIYDFNKLNIPPSVTVSNIETVNLQVPVGVAGDVSGWSGLATLNISTKAGDIAIKAASTTEVNISAGRVDLREPAAVTVDVTGGKAVTITSDSSVVTTVANPHAGMKLVFTLIDSVSFATAKISLTNATLQNHLDAAAAGTSAATQVKWFQYQGDTYLVADNSPATTYLPGTDATIKLLGLVDLDTALLNAVAGSHIALTLN